jgi:hypothetical protein
MEIIRIHRCTVHYNTEHHNSHIYYYEQYILDIIRRICHNHPEWQLNIFFSNKPATLKQQLLATYQHTTTNQPRKNNIFISMNCEHILVRQGGRDSFNAPIGKIKDPFDHNYLVRITEYEDYRNMDIVVDYSIPNIVHVSESGIYDDYSKKMVYVSPSLYKYENTPAISRTITTLTTFSNAFERRAYFLQQMRQYMPHKHMNMTNCYDCDDLQKLYKNTRILINIHQTDHHHSFEELRVLPALQCGVIVVSEWSPLYEKVPYNDYVIWANFENLIPTVLHVIENYDHYYHSIFGKRNKKYLLTDLDKMNYTALERKLVDFS